MAPSSRAHVTFTFVRRHWMSSWPGEPEGGAAHGAGCRQSVLVITPTSPNDGSWMTATVSPDTRHRTAEYWTPDRRWLRQAWPWCRPPAWCKSNRRRGAVRATSKLGTPPLNMSQMTGPHQVRIRNRLHGSHPRPPRTMTMAGHQAVARFHVGQRSRLRQIISANAGSVCSMCPPSSYNTPDLTSLVCASVATWHSTADSYQTSGGGSSAQDKPV